MFQVVMNSLRMLFHVEPYVSVDNYRDRDDKLVILIKETKKNFLNY